MWGVRRAYYADELDAIIFCEAEGATLKVLDVIAADIPPLGAILAAAPFDFDAAEFHFVLDVLGGGPWEYVASDPADCLMVRGRVDPEPPIMLSPLARC